MKYIDAEKLIAEIERHIKHYESSNRDDFKNGELYICQELLSLIDSLRQEQPKADLEKEIVRFISNSTKMNKGEWRGKYAISDIGFRAVAHHFFELGQKDAANKYDACFKAGSQWIAEQGVSVEANIRDCSGSGYLSLVMPNNINNRYKFFNDGDRVIVQVRKKEESK